MTIYNDFYEEQTKAKAELLNGEMECFLSNNYDMYSLLQEYSKL